MKRAVWAPAVLLFVCGVYLTWTIARPQEAGAPRPVTPRGDLAADEKATIDLFEKASPSVVHITSMALRQDLFTLDITKVQEGTGSGFIWDESGHVVTNYHVIQNADSAEVTLADGSTWDAKPVGVAADKDLAVLKIGVPKERLKPLAIGTSGDLKVGQKVLAIGNPFGLDQSLTTGVISALGRQIESVSRRPITGVIQTDAAINPGNSGGPLLDSAGRLIGLNTAIFSPSGGSAGIGFAIPVDTVNRFVPQLIRDGRIIRPGLGVSIADDRVAARFKVKGALVAGVVAGSSAETAGIVPATRDRRGRVTLGDAITEIDGKPVASSDSLFLMMETYKVGDTVTVTLEREGKTRDVKVRLQEIK